LNKEEKQKTKQHGLMNVAVFFFWRGNGERDFFSPTRSYSISKQVGDGTHKWQATSFVDPTSHTLVQSKSGTEPTIGK
jgi:hypothetical protein